MGNFHQFQTHRYYLSCRKLYVYSFYRINAAVWNNRCFSFCSYRVHPFIWSAISRGAKVDRTRKKKEKKERKRVVVIKNRNIS